MNDVLHMLNTIAYMSSAFNRQDWRRVGFKKLDGAYVSWGVKVGDDYYSAMYVSSAANTKVISDQEAFEKPQIAFGRVFPIMLFGSDNTSYVIRFKTEEEVQAFISSEEPFNCNAGTPTALYYNS